MHSLKVWASLLPNNFSQCFTCRDATPFLPPGKTPTQTTQVSKQIESFSHPQWCLTEKGRHLVQVWGSWTQKSQVISHYKSAMATKRRIKERIKINLSHLVSKTTNVRHTNPRQIHSGFKGQSGGRSKYSCYQDVMQAQRQSGFLCHETVNNLNLVFKSKLAAAVEDYSVFHIWTFIKSSHRHNTT